MESKRSEVHWHYQDKYDRQSSGKNASTIKNIVQRGFGIVEGFETFDYKYGGW